VTTTAPQNSTKNFVYGHFYDGPRVPKGLEKKTARGKHNGKSLNMIKWSEFEVLPAFLSANTALF
jgi:hypothetical protein